ncbi:MAG TPA: hypothetical protein EYP56_01565 [Planctomycetaceae bacterium]|nr:hypothetical protein [Planctomycetaceae bacterium]
MNLGWASAAGVGRGDSIPWYRFETVEAEAPSLASTGPKAGLCNDWSRSCNRAVAEPTGSDRAIAAPGRLRSRFAESPLPGDTTGLREVLIALDRAARDRFV